MGTAQKFSKVLQTFVRIFRMGKYKKLEINYFITNISNLKNKNSKKELRMKIGIDLGGSHIAVGVINEKGYIVEKIEKRLMSKEKSNIKKSIEEYIEKNVTELRNKYSINEIGIAVPGSVTNTEIIKSVNLGVKDYKLVEELSKKIDLPIKMQNDAKCAAIAECKLGALKNYKRSLFLTLGTGIGGAVVINGKLLDTGNLPGCEFGHMIIQRNGIECKCGKKGCFEKYASMKALKTNLRKELGVDEKTRGQELLDYIRQNPDDKNINKIIDEFMNKYDLPKEFSDSIYNTVGDEQYVEKINTFISPGENSSEEFLLGFRSKNKDLIIKWIVILNYLIEIIKTFN